eukprot:6064677-Pyramimonas_sp.AAC.1
MEPAPRPCGGRPASAGRLKCLCLAVSSGRRADGSGKMSTRKQGNNRADEMSKVEKYAARLLAC